MAMGFDPTNPNDFMGTYGDLMGIQWVNGEIAMFEWGFDSWIF